MIDKNIISDEDLAKMISIMVEAQRNNEDSVQKLSQDTRTIIEKLARIEFIEVEIKGLNERIEKLEKSKTWAYRLIISALIVIILGFIQHNKSVQKAEQRFEKRIEQHVEKAVNSNQQKNHK